MSDGLVVRQHAAKPALVDVGHTYSRCLLGDHLGGRTLCTNKQNFFALGCHIAHFNKRFVKGRESFFKINDVNLVSSTKDKGCHFGVPESGLVAEVHAGGQHVSHTYSHFIFSGLTICRASQALTEITSIDDDRHPRTCVEARNFLSVPSCLYCRALRVIPFPETLSGQAADS